MQKKNTTDNYSYFQKDIDPRGWSEDNSAVCLNYLGEGKITVTLTSSLINNDNVRVNV